MVIRVRFFATISQQTGRGNAELKLAPAATLADLRAALQQRYPQLRLPAGTMFAINQEYAAPSALLSEGDEVAILPPVSGG